MTADIESILQKQQLQQIELEPYASVNKATSILATIEEMRNTPNIHAAIIVEDEKPIGILTKRNIMHRVALSQIDLNSAVETIMTPNPKTLTLHSTLRETLDLLNVELRRTLPIVDEKGNIVGAATARALINHIAAHFPTAIYNLPPDPHQVSSAPDGA